jgi:hypothetical protein
MSPLRFFIAPLVGLALALGNFVQGAPFRFHPQVGIPREPGTTDVPGDGHLVTGIEN